tara:strand:- start:9670 stop:10320 length:651 start_codon:yes stop_codon:yes gene_type:complete
MRDPYLGDDDDDGYQEHELEYEYDEAARRWIGNERRKTTGVVRKAGTGFDEVGGAEFIEAMRELKLPALKPPPNLLPRENLRAPILYEHAPQNRRTFTPWHETELGALMETRPFQEPHPDWETKNNELADLRTAVQEVFDSLTEDEEWLYNCLVEVGLSLRFLSRVLEIPKSTLARRRDSLAQKLREGLLGHAVVREYLFTRSGYRESPHTPEETD